MGVSSPEKTKRPTPAPPLKSVTGATDRAPEGSAIWLNALAEAKRSDIDSNFIILFVIRVA